MSAWAKVPSDCQQTRGEREGEGRRMHRAHNHTKTVHAVPRKAKKGAKKDPHDVVVIVIVNASSSSEHAVGELDEETGEMQ